MLLHSRLTALTVAFPVARRRYDASLVLYACTLLCLLLFRFLFSKMTDSFASLSLHSLSLSLPSSPPLHSHSASPFMPSSPLSPLSLPHSPLSSFPPSSPPSPSPSLLSESSLRLATFNCGLGFQHKLPLLHARCVSLQLDVIAVQEIGDPALLNHRFPPYSLIKSNGTKHQAGVGLLIAHALLPRVRHSLQSDSGRLVGVVLELHKGHQLLLVSAYMPTGLDHRPSGSDEHELARQLYAEIARWSVGMQQVVVMGDLNETLTVHDREPPPRSAPAASGLTPISYLTQDGYTDVWRALHPSAQLTPGFTHRIDGEHARPSQSRIDYLWCKGIDRADLLRVRIDTSLRHLSHHHLLWMEMRLTHPVSAATDSSIVPPARIPDLRDLTEQQELAYAEKLQRKLEQHEHALYAAIAQADTESLSWAASHLTLLVRAVAWTRLPLTGGKPMQSQCILQLQRQRSALTRLQHCSRVLLENAPAGMRGHSDCLTHCHQWRQRYEQCMLIHQLQWTVDPYSDSNAHAWMDDTAQLLRLTRISIRAEQKRMLLHSSSKPQLDVNPAAAVHRMMRSDESPAQLLSVLNKNNELTSNADELKATMADHFRSVFAIPPGHPAAAPPGSRPVPEMLFDKPNIDSHWYDSLMRDVEGGELLATLADVPLISAPGEDEVSSGLWKLSLRSCELLRSLVSRLFTACLSKSIFPSCWKSSIIVPLVKDSKKERSMNNIRPISLQSCLGKLLNKLLAHRLGHIFAQHPILHPAQRGFINGGTITKCIDELLDAWEWGRTGGNKEKKPLEQYTLFYDIKQAYDSVQVDVIERAMKRLRMPDAFIRLVVNSLTGLTSRVRTAYGLSELFDVLRSLRQGDPLAPLLFVILMDALHVGLDCNPFTGQQHGLVIQPLSTQDPVSLPSLGYADDTTVLTDSLDNMRIQNEWVHYFMWFNRMLLNPTKCELVGRDASGECVTAAALALHNIAIHGQPLTPVPHDRSIRYLGVHACFNGSWKEQRKRALGKIMLFTRAVAKFSVTLQQTVYMFNAFLMPALELALHYVHGKGCSEWVRHCDSHIIGSIKHAVRSPLKLSNSALALSLHLLLPSWLESSIKVSELFLRVNDPDTRWGQLGRLLIRSLPGAELAQGRADAEGRMSRAIFLATRDSKEHRSLRWSLKQGELHKSGSRLTVQHLFAQSPADSLRALCESECSSHKLLELTDVQQRDQPRIAHDLWRGHGADMPRHTVHAYTDGSHDAQSATSSWAVTIADEWLDSGYGSIPSDEKLLTHRHVAGASIFGSIITCTRGVYPAELQAIARTLAMFPSSSILHIYSDSQSSLQAIRTYELLRNERRRMRMSAHTLLQLIHHLLRVRTEAGGNAQWHHVKAHTDGEDIHSVGNRLSDWQANHSRAHPNQPTPLSLQQLPLDKCELHLSIFDSRDPATALQVIDDVRRTALCTLRVDAHTHWRSKKDGCEYFAGRAATDTGRMVLRLGSGKQQITFVHLVTNSLHFRWAQPAPFLQPPPAAAAAAVVKDTLHKLTCRRCSALDPLQPPCILTPAHLSSCSHAHGVRYRTQLCRDLLALLHHGAPNAECLRPYRHHTPALSTLLLQLLPLAPSHAASPAAAADDQTRHLTFAMCGLLTRAQLTAAAKLLGFTDPLIDLPKGIRLMQQMCLLCFDHLAREFKPP